MAAMHTIAPQNVRQSFARAKSLLKRNETTRALEAFINALDLYDRNSLISKARFEMEVLIQESVADVGRQPAIRILFDRIGKSAGSVVTYAPGKEDKLKNTLTILHKALLAEEDAKKAKEQGAKQSRREALEQRGLAYLQAGDAARGKSALRVLAEEFGHEPGVLSQIGLWMRDAKLPYDAAECLEIAIDRFPKDHRVYGVLTAIYSQLHEYQKAEAVYAKAIRQFGKHPRTLLNLARLYLAWNKKEKAFQAAQDAFNRDNSLTEAKEIMDKLA